MSSSDKVRGRGRPPQLSRDRILEAVASLPNVDTLTMRDLASALRVRHATLYYWVKNRDELFDLLGETVADRVLARVAGTTGGWRTRVRGFLAAMYDELVALPGYATHLSRPHPHNAHSTGRLRDALVGILVDAGVAPDLAEQSWYIVTTGVVGWVAFEEQSMPVGADVPRFEVFAGVLLRGLPARGADA